MKPLRVLIVHRADDNYRRLSGWWSHEVPEFVWHTMKVNNGFDVDLAGAEENFDLVLLEDWVFGNFRNKRLPLAYVTVDSARSQGQLEKNLHQGSRANLILSDSDRLEHLATPLGTPVRRFAHCVNRNMFYQDRKTVDVAFLCWPTPERSIVRRYIEDVCQRKGYSFLTGTASPEIYASRIRSARIVVHKPHVKEGRSWRVFDVMASNGCLITTDPIPFVTGDFIAANKHYVRCDTLAHVEQSIGDLLADKSWMYFAEQGRELVEQNHTWDVRSAQLRETLHEVLGL